MNIIWYLDCLAPLSVILLPFIPNNILIYIYWYPIIYYIIWILCDGCPLNKYHSNENRDKSDDFLLTLIKKYICKNMTQKQFSRYIGLFIILSIILSSYKLLNSCECKF